MPSPFPGMDPWLEAQGFWPDFHVRSADYASGLRLPLADDERRWAKERAQAAQ
jgi:hypothetical protein